MMMRVRPNETKGVYYPDRFKFSMERLNEDLELKDVAMTKKRFQGWWKTSSTNSLNYLMRSYTFMRSITEVEDARKFISPVIKDKLEGRDTSAIHTEWRFGSTD